MGDDYQCTTRPKTYQNVQTCEKIQPEFINTKTLKMFHRWMMTMQDEVERNPNFGRVFIMNKMRKVYDKHSRTYCLDPELKVRRINDVHRFKV
jgi:hypothetical protein